LAGVNDFKFEAACSPLPATQAAKRILDQYKLDIAIGEEWSDATRRLAKSAVVIRH
jgi:hypothetical protein